MIEATIREGFQNANARSTRIEVTMKEGFDRIDDKFEHVYSLIIRIGSGLIGTLIAGIIAIVISHL